MGVEVVSILDSTGFQAKCTLEGMAFFFSSCWSVGLHRTPPQRIWPLFLITLQNLNVKSYCWIQPHTWVIKHEEIKPVVVLKLPSTELIFTVLEGSSNFSEEEIIQ